MLYRVIKDEEAHGEGNSFGIEVAKLANFPESIIAVAQEKALEFEKIMKMADAPEDEHNNKTVNLKNIKIHEALCKFSTFNFKNKQILEIQEFLMETFHQIQQ